MPKTLFRSKFNRAALLGVVAEVAKTGAPAEPSLISQRQWDASRAHAGYADSPTSRQICQRLGLSWRELLELCLENKDPALALARREGAQPEDAINQEDAISALRGVVLPLGQGSVTPDQYAAQRERLIAADRRHYLHGGRMSLPTVGQIETLFEGGWDEALVAASLEPRPAASGGRRGMPLLEALDLFLAQHGGLPSLGELRRWASRRGIALAAKGRRPWQEILDELRQDRQARGMWTPPQVTIEGRRGRPPKNASPTSPPAQPAAAPPEPSADLPKRLIRDRTQAELEQALQDFLAWLGSNERPTQRNYRRYCREHPGTPWPVAFDRHGGWGSMRDRALRAARSPRRER
jgi:hypothetical protein